MERAGYDTRFSVAITACSSVGVIIPPSIPMVVWGGVMQVSVGALFLGGAIPGLLIGLALMATVYGYAKVRDYPVAAHPTLSEFWSALKGAALAMLTPILVIGGIVGGIVTPTESAIIAAGYALFLGLFVYRTVRIRDLGLIVYDTGRFASVSLFAIGTASAFGLMLSFFNVPRLIVGTLTALQFGSLGTGFRHRGAVPDLRPVHRRDPDGHHPRHRPDAGGAGGGGLDPISFAIIGIVSLAFGLVTPPYGLCLLISAAIGGLNVVQVMRDVALILLPMLAILLLIIAFPEISLWLPRMLLPGAFR
jgi:TRAP-type C4-dicarboxylate transport system permease large subunit